MFEVGEHHGIFSYLRFDYVRIKIFIYRLRGIKMMTLELDEAEAKVLAEMISVNISVMVTANAPDAVIDIAFDMLKKFQDFLSDCGQEANERKYDHIDYINWAE